MTPPPVPPPMPLFSSPGPINNADFRPLAPIFEVPFEDDENEDYQPEEYDFNGMMIPKIPALSRAQKQRLFGEYGHLK